LLNKVKKIGGSKYHPKAVVSDMLVHCPKDIVNDQKKKAMIYFHGGGGVAGTPLQHAKVCDKYAIDCKAVIFNCDYRLAPEHKAPAALYDAYACVKHIIADCKTWGVDPHRICIFGESGGGWVTAGCALLLAEMGEGDLVKFHMPMLPMVNDMYWREDFKAKG
jgi:acetyl esterase/lipase